jgi:hypothetical protein
MRTQELNMFIKTMPIASGGGRNRCGHREAAGNWFVLLRRFT